MGRVPLLFLLFLFLLFITCALLLPGREFYTVPFLNKKEGPLDGMAAAAPSGGGKHFDSDRPAVFSQSAGLEIEVEGKGRQCITRTLLPPRVVVVATLSREHNPASEDGPCRGVLLLYQSVYTFTTILLVILSSSTISHRHSHQYLNKQCRPQPLSVFRR